MKKLIIPALLFTLSFSAIADISLPRIDAPDELVRGDFEEGTITQISESEIAEFLPWAQNAQNLLNRALSTARSVPLRDRLPLIERAIRSVVNRSGDKQYQMFMRFSLNRGLLLLSEMSKQMDMDEIGAQESALDILQRSIDVALHFYESDLSFQRRSQDGEVATNLNYAQFGIHFFQQIYPGVLNVLDATAQYRLLSKLVEMTNWDLSRDSHANNYADSIIETYEMLELLPVEPSSSDRVNLINIRRLNSLKLFSMRNVNVEREVPHVTRASRVTGPSIEVGSVVLENHGTWSVRTVKLVAADGTYQLDDNQWYHNSYVRRLVDSHGRISLDQEVYESHENGSIDRVEYISSDGSYYLKRAGTWFHPSYVDHLVESYGRFRVGEQVVETHGTRSVQTIRRITSKGVFLLDDGKFYHHTYIVKLH